MSLSSRLVCVLVLAVSSLSRGENQTTVSPGRDVKEDADVPVVATPRPLLTDESEAARGSPSTTSAQTAATTDLRSASTTAEEETVRTDDSVRTTQEVTAAAPTTGGVNVRVTTVATATAGTSSTAGYVILVLISLVIVVLCVILYFLRRVSRTYSFDLHRQTPNNNLNEPIGTFEPVYLDDLDQPAHKDQMTTEGFSAPPVSNGATLQEPSCSGDSAPQDQQDAQGPETPPPRNTSNSSNPSLGDRPPPARHTSSPLSSTCLFFDAIGDEQQNENNNNPSICSSDPFVEINLDEPACDQLLTSPEAPSSVLPFSPFSLSSS